MTVFISTMEIPVTNDDALANSLMNISPLNKLKWFKDYKKMYLHFMSYWGFCPTELRRPSSQWSNPTFCLSYTVNTIPANILATSGARASAQMVLTPKSRNIPSPASEQVTLFVVSTVLADGLASLSTRTSAGTVMRKFGSCMYNESCMYKGLALKG